MTGVPRQTLSARSQCTHAFSIRYAFGVSARFCVPSRELKILPLPSHREATGESCLRDHVEMGLPAGE